MNETVTDSEIGGWIVHANTLSSYIHRAGALTSAYDHIGPKGVSVMLHKMRLETAMDVVEWLSGKK